MDKTEELPPHVRSAADDAIKLWKSGDPEAALKMLLPLAESYPEALALKATIGYIYYDTERPLEAYPFIKHVSDAQPNHKLVARMLLHILDQLGMHAEAVAQAERLAKLTGLDDDEDLSLDVAARGTKLVN